MAVKGWTTAQLRDELSLRIKKSIKKKLDPSITNSNQFIDLAIREKLEKLEVSKK